MLSFQLFTSGTKISSNSTFETMAETILEDAFMNIPPHKIIDILARLPPKEVIQCRCVCKAWLKLISEPEFVNLHLSKSPTCLIVYAYSYSPPDSASFSLVEVEDEYDHHDVRRIAGTDREIQSSHEMLGMTMIGSIDGLVCINEYALQYDLIHVWNPIIGELFTVQTPRGEQKYPNVTTYGFGISSKKYRVVKIFQEIENTGESGTNSRQILDSTCHVYTIGDSVWKNIGYAPYMYSCRTHGLFFNGNLHWLINDKDSSEQICCLDLEKELFRPFPPPPELHRGHIATLNLYKSCLSVCDNTSDFDIVIWVMKEYGVQNSWIKEVVISKDLIFHLGNFFEVVHIIKVFKDGEILLLWRDSLLFMYHQEWKTVQEIDVIENITGPSTNNHHLNSIPCFQTTDYVPSVVSLKSLGELNVYRR